MCLLLVGVCVLPATVQPEESSTSCYILDQSTVQRVMVGENDFVNVPSGRLSLRCPPNHPGKFMLVARNETYKLACSQYNVTLVIPTVVVNYNVLWPLDYENPQTRLCVGSVQHLTNNVVDGEWLIEFHLSDEVPFTYVFFFSFSSISLAHVNTWNISSCFCNFRDF